VIATIIDGASEIGIKHTYGKRIESWMVVEIFMASCFEFLDFGFGGIMQSEEYVMSQTFFGRRHGSSATDDQEDR
jgi:hypothetical protein